MSGFLYFTFIRMTEVLFVLKYGLLLSCALITDIFLALDLSFVGFQIVGGEKTGKLDLGIFIHSVIPGGPADLEGTLKPGE